MKLYPMIGVSQPRTDTVKRAAEILKDRDMLTTPPEPARPVGPRFTHKPGSRWRGTAGE
jgi:hypothetical protein